MDLHIVGPEKRPADYHCSFELGYKLMEFFVHLYIFWGKIQILSSI